MGAQHTLRASKMKPNAGGGGGGGGTVFVNDTFTGADGTILQSRAGETGATWTKHPLGDANDATLVSNALKVPASNSMYYTSGTPATAEYDVEALIIVLSNNAGSGHGICGRMDTAASTFYMARVNMSNGNVELYKRITGTFTLLGQWAYVAATGVNPVVKLQLRDAAKKVFVDGVERISSADNTITGAGRAGFRGGGNDSTGQGHLFDYLKATNA